MEIIKMENVCKSYPYYEKEKGVMGSIKNVFQRKPLFKEAVKDISVSIEQGSVVGFIGLNGAGKTTTLKMLSGIIKTTSGIVRINGYDPFEKKAEYLSQISMVMGNKSQLWWDIPAIDTFELNRQIFGVDKKKFEEVLEELVVALDVRHLLNIQVRRLSLGERMKMELIAALIHSPSVIFLDEPTIGLDIISQYSIREFLKTYNKKYKATIIVTSHNFDDIVYLCDRLLIIDKGKIISDSSFENFIQKYSDKKIITIKFTPDSGEIINQLKNNSFEIIEEKENALKISVNEKEIITLTNSLTTNYSKYLKDINIENLEIGEIIRSIYT